MTTLTGEQLKALGYRRVSNRYRTVARIDRADWLRSLPAGMASYHDQQPGAANDYYRRILSEDKIRDVPEEEFKKIPNSGHDPCGYIPKDGDRITAEETLDERAFRLMQEWREMPRTMKSWILKDALDQATAIIEQLLARSEDELNDYA